MRSILRRVRRRLVSPVALLQAENGNAAVEFALILPAALMLLSLAVMGGQGFEIQRRVALSATTVTGLVSGTPFVSDPLVNGATQINVSSLDTDLALSSEVMYPQPSSGLLVVVSELFVNAANNTGTVVWSRAYNGATALTQGTVLSLQPSIVAAGGTYLIYGQVQYTYQPVSLWPSIGAITLSSSQMLVPRNASQITINYNQ